MMVGPSQRFKEAHLLLEWGRCDLADYFEEIPTPATALETLKFWEDMYQVALALANIHNIKRGQGRSEYHMVGSVTPPRLTVR